MYSPFRLLLGSSLCFLFILCFSSLSAFAQSERWKPRTAPADPDPVPVTTPSPVPPGSQAAAKSDPSPVSIPHPRHCTTGRADLDRIYEKAALKYDLDVNVLIEQGRVESINFNPAVISGRIASPAGAVGISQFMSGTARRYGLQVGPGRDDRTDPELAIDAQARYMRDLLRLFNGRYDLAVAAYNCGENRKTLRAGRIPQIPETLNYTARILGSVKRATARGPVSFFSGILPEKFPQNSKNFDLDAISERFLH